MDYNKQLIQFLNSSGLMSLPQAADQIGIDFG